MELIYSWSRIFLTWLPLKIPAFNTVVLENKFPTSELWGTHSNHTFLYLVLKFMFFSHANFIHFILIVSNAFLLSRSTQKSHLHQIWKRLGAQLIMRQIVLQLWACEIKQVMNFYNKTRSKIVLTFPFQKGEIGKKKGIAGLK